MSVLSLVRKVYAFVSFYPQATDVGETHTLVPATVLACGLAFYITGNV
jgi:hypothetical protein